MPAKSRTNPALIRTAWIGAEQSSREGVQGSHCPVFFNPTEDYIRLVHGPDGIEAHGDPPFGERPNAAVKWAWPVVAAGDRRVIRPARRLGGAAAASGSPPGSGRGRPRGPDLRHWRHSPRRVYRGHRRGVRSVRRPVALRQPSAPGTAPYRGSGCRWKTVRDRRFEGHILRTRPPPPRPGHRGLWEAASAPVGVRGRG